jgi:1-acyl-sn-glycerol-3-phosphate acyltransferase
MAKAEIWKSTILGRVVSAFGAFPINRGQADREAVRSAMDILQAGAVLGIFPEGHRQRSGRLGEINPGVTLFSLREGVMTIPVVLSGTDRVVRKGLLRFPRVRVFFGDPLLVPGPEVGHSERAKVTVDKLKSAFDDLLETMNQADRDAKAGHGRA